MESALFFQVGSIWGDCVENVPDDETECQEPTHDQKVGGGALKDATVAAGGGSVSLQLSAGPVSCQAAAAAAPGRHLDSSFFLFPNQLSGGFGQVREKLAKVFIAQVHRMTSSSKYLCGRNREFLKYTPIFLNKKVEAQILDFML